MRLLGRFELLSTINTIKAHKKKIIFFSVSVLYGSNLLIQNNRDIRIRRFYAELAKKHGDSNITPTERSRRITVLLNPDASNRKARRIFEKNALPLLNLAGLEVDILNIKTDLSSDGLANLQNTDAIFVVGGDGTLSRVITNILDGILSSSLPIGVFPGGRENRSLQQLVPTIFAKKGDLRMHCESAMAVIENTRRTIYPAICEIFAEDSSGSAQSVNTTYLFSGVRLGWFEHCCQKMYRFWFLGSLKGYFTYLWEFLKRSPVPLNIDLTYEDFCDGCSKCFQKLPPQTEVGWLSFLFPSRQANGRDFLPNFSTKINPNCGAQKKQSILATDIQISLEQADKSSQLKFKSGGQNLGKMASIFEGWKRIYNKSLIGDDEFYDAKINPGNVSIKFLRCPEFVRKLSLDGDWEELENHEIKRIVISVSNKKLEFLLPMENFRISLKDI